MYGGGHLLWFKDLNLSDMGVSPILVVGENADLKEECLHWSEHEIETPDSTLELSLLSIFICDVYVHPFFWFIKIQSCDLLDV